MSTPIKEREREWADRCLREEYQHARAVLNQMPEPDSLQWEAYVAQVYAEFRESGQ